MPPLQALTAADVSLVMRRYSDVLATHRRVIDALNVYPVPDGDTGTNMSLTLRSVVEALPGGDGERHDGRDGGDGDRHGGDADMAAVCRAIAHGSLMGARGNSGVIVSQFLRAMAGVWSEAPLLDAAGLARSLQVSSEAAYGAVQRPVEGTILTVGRDLAGAAVQAAGGGAGLGEVAEAALAEGRASLARTPELLEVLRTAGVVDAGGQGLVLLLDALLHVVDGRPLPEAPEVTGHALGDGHDGHDGHGAGGVADLRYEVMFLLDAADEAVDGFRERWGGIGDSIVVVGGDGLWNCHIHTDDIGAAVEAGIAAGRPHRIAVTDLLEQVGHTEHVAAPVRTTSAVVAVAAGDGVRRLMESMGAAEVVVGGQTMNPSAATLLAALERAPADEVIVLPNNKNIVPVALQLPGMTDKRVVVVPTHSIPEGLSAMVGFDADADAGSNGATMEANAGAVTAGEVTRAVRDATTPAGPVAEGDFMGLAGGAVRCVAPALVAASCELLACIVGDHHEIVTLVRGAEAGEADTGALVDWLAENRPHVEVEVHAGGQPLYHYYVGVE